MTKSSRVTVCSSAAPAWLAFGKSTRCALPLALRMLLLPLRLLTLSLVS